jgi:hypothetical protein
MRKKSSNPKVRALLERPIEIEELPPIVPRPVAAAFSLLNPRTLLRAEEEGKLTPIKRGKQSVSYRRDELLRFLGLTKSKAEPPPLHQRAKAAWRSKK